MINDTLQGRQYSRLAEAVIWLVLSFLLFNSCVSSEEETPRVTAALVGEKVIYLDQIQPPASLTTLMGLKTDPAFIKTYREQTLRHLIREEVFQQEIITRGINPTNELVEREARAMTEREWAMLGKSEDEREEMLEKLREKMARVRDGLSFWLQDKRKGDEFAKRELEPLGITQYYWQWLTSKAADPETMEMLNAACSHDKTAFHRDRLIAARKTLAQKMLISAVVPEVRVTEDELRRLQEITGSCERIELFLFQRNSEAAAREIRTTFAQQSSRLLRQGGRILLEGNLDHEFFRTYACLLAVHNSSLEEGSLSGVFVWDGNGPRTWNVLFISMKKAREKGTEGSAQETSKLKEVLEDFKRGQAFEAWLREKARAVTIIRIPEYEKVLD